MNTVEFDTAELDQESVELLPARQTLCWHHGGYYSSLDLGLGLHLSLVSSSYGGGW